MATKKQRWTLVQHLRDQGIEPEAPFHPIWKDMGDLLGANLIGKGPLTPAMLDECSLLDLAAAPFVVTMYRWAANSDVNLKPFEGPINGDTRVRLALEDYTIARAEKQGYHEGLDALLDCLLAYAKLSPKMASALASKFNHPGESEDLLVWLAPKTGMLPAIGTWKTMREHMLVGYPLVSEDLQALGGSPKSRHWSVNHRMDLVLGAWLAEQSDYKAMPLYNHLPNIAMDQPDTVTAVFWTVASQYMEQNPNSHEAQMLGQWMQEHPQYKRFFDEARPLVEGLLGTDAVVCGKELHRLWTKTHAPAMEQHALEGLLEP